MELTCNDHEYEESHDGQIEALAVLNLSECVEGDEEEEDDARECGRVQEGGCDHCQQEVEQMEGAGGQHGQLVT